MRPFASTAVRLRGLAALAIVSIASCAANAQVPTSGNVFFGYSYLNTTPIAFLGFNSRQGLNGWEGSVEGKVFRYVGLVADFSGNYGSQTLPIAVGTCPINVVCSPLRSNTHVQNFLFGPRVSANFGKIRPFGEFLVGAGHVSGNVTSPFPDNFPISPDTTFAMAIGGGLDYKIIRPIAARFQGDYIRTSFFGTTQNNIRLSTGIVVRF
jgi:opacity protein-like surface antigen